MANFWDKVTQRDLEASFGRDRLDEAARLLRKNPIEDLDVDKGGVLSGMVFDGRAHYHASIAPDNRTLNMLCECAGMRDGPCLHVLALMLAWLGIDYQPDDQEDEPPSGEIVAGLQPSFPQVQSALFPSARREDIRADWLKRLEALTVNDMRNLAAARGIKLKGTLRDQVTQGLLRVLEEPAKLAESVAGMEQDARRLLDLLCALPGTTPDFNMAQISRYLEAALANGQKARPLDDILDDLHELGLFILPDYSRFYPVPLQAIVQPLPDPHLFKPFSGEPQRIVAARPFQHARLALRLLLLAQSSKLHCAPHPGGKKNTWPMPAEAEKGIEIEIFAEPAYLESGLRSGLARSLDLSETQVDLAARLLEDDRFWPQRAPEKLGRRLFDWLKLSPQEQSRHLFQRLLSFPSQVELDLAMKASSFTPWRNSSTGLTYKVFLEGLAQARLRLARLLARLPAGQWVEIDSVLRTLHGLQPGWLMEFSSRLTDPYSQRILANSPTWASIGRKRIDPLIYDDWRKTYGQFYLAMLTGSLAWLGLVDVGWQGDQPVALRLAEFGEFLIGRRADFALTAPAARAPALVVRPDWGIELDLDAAPLELINLLLQIAVPAPDGKGETRKLVYRINEGGLGWAFENGWTLERIVASLQEASGQPLPPELVERMRPLWEHFGRLQIYEDMTLVEFADDFCLPELLASTRLSQILVTAFSPRLIAVRTDAAADFVAELQAKGYTPHHEGVQHG